MKMKKGREGKKGIEEVFKSNRLWPGIERFIKSGRTSPKIIEQFIDKYVYFDSDEIIEVLFENAGPGVYLVAMFKLAVLLVQSPRALYHLMKITGLPLLSTMRMDTICKKRCSHITRFQIAGCLINHGIIHQDILTSLLTCSEKVEPAYLQRILEEAPQRRDIELDQCTICFLRTSNLAQFEWLKLFFSKFLDFRLFQEKTQMMTRWSRRQQKAVLTMNISDWCQTKKVFEMTLAYFKAPQERLFLLNRLGRVDIFVPSKKSIDTFLKSFSEPGLLKLIGTFPKICFTTQHVHAIVNTSQIATKTPLQVFQRAPGVYPVVDLDPLGNDEDTATLTEFAFLFSARIDSLVCLMRHRIPEPLVIGFLRFCNVREASVDRISRASEEFGYSDQFIAAFSARML